MCSVTSTNSEQAWSVKWQRLCFELHNTDHNCLQIEFSTQMLNAPWYPDSQDMKTNWWFWCGKRGKLIVNKCYDTWLFTDYAACTFGQCTHDNICQTILMLLHHLSTLIYSFCIYCCSMFEFGESTCWLRLTLQCTGCGACCSTDAN